MSIRQLNGALRPETATIAALPGVAPIEQALEASASRQRALSDILLALRKRGGNCRVCPVALAAIDASTTGRAAALLEMARGWWAPLDMPAATGMPDATLCWNEGNIELVANIGRYLHWQRGTLHIRDADLPDTVLGILPGRPLQDAMELPFPTPGVIVTSTRRGEYLEIAAEGPHAVADRIRGIVLP